MLSWHDPYIVILYVKPSLMVVIVMQDLRRKLPVTRTLFPWHNTSQFSLTREITKELGIEKWIIPSQHLNPRFSFVIFWVSKLPTYQSFVIVIHKILRSLPNLVIFRFAIPVVLSNVNRVPTSSQFRCVVLYCLLT